VNRLPTAGDRILVVGDIVTDVVAVLDAPLLAGSDTAARITVTGGGAGANTAAWLASRGAPVTLCGVVGADATGEARLSELIGAGVDLAVREAAEATTGSIVVLAERSERTFVTDRGANLLLSEADVSGAIAGVPDLVHVHVSGYPLLDDRSRAAGRHALALALRKGMTTSVDAASAGPLRLAGGAAFLSWVRGCHVLFANVDEAEALLGEASSVAPADELAARVATAVAGGAHDPIVVVKLGRDGAVAATAAGLVVSVPAVHAETVDPTGAGDAFAAGFLMSWRAGGDLTEALQDGAQLGALATATVGARPPVLY